jgi:two-component system, chemotaxis family, response regulator PixH
MNTALVVEDSLTDITIIVSYLKQGGIDVLTASSAEEARSKVDIYKPDVIILDVVLPDRSGFEICRDLKGEAQTKNIPVIICSTKGGEMDKFWGMKQGADAYLVKPIDREQLMRTIKQLIN